MHFIVTMLTLYSFDTILQERSSHEGEYSVVSFKFSDNVMCYAYMINVYLYRVVIAE